MLKTYPPTALETDKCPPHYIIIVRENIAPEGEKPVYHQIGRCTKKGCKFIKDYGPVDGSGKIATVRSRAACAKGGRNGRKKKRVLS